VARIDTLRLLLSAEIPSDLPTIEASMRAITERLGEIETGTPVHTIAHARLNDLLTAREQAARRPTPGGG
jgi:hypothetical protein